MGWLASGNLNNADGDKPVFTGLVGIRGDFENPILIPAPDRAKALSDITIGSDRTVYSSDPLGGGVYAKRKEADKLQTFVAPGTFRSPQGLATSADNTKLYVSDYRYGIAVVDLETRDVSRLASDIPIILDGVDGLWRFGNELIAVQNGTSPMRISAFELSEDGMLSLIHI